MTTSSNATRSGYYLGAGAILNISVGFIPKRIDIFNVTDRTVYAIGFTDKMFAFTSGSLAVPAGAKITGITSGAVAKIKDSILVSGTYAGGDAAGFFIADAEDVVGTFQAENVTVQGSPAAQDDGTVAVPIEHTGYQSAALGFVAGAAATTGIVSFVGSTTASKGFTVGATLAVSGKLYRWVAYR